MTHPRLTLIRSFVVLCSAILVSWPAAAQEVDFSRYDALLERSIAAHRAAEDAGEDQRTELLEAALNADTDLIEWLDHALPSEAFAGLSPDDQAVLVSARSRVEYLRAGALIELERCSEARARLRTLLDQPIGDDELRPRLLVRYDDATECEMRTRPGTLTVNATPADAVILVDGVPDSAARDGVEVPIGPHEITVEAEGFRSHTEALDVTAGQSLSLDIALEHLPPPEHPPAPAVVAQEPAPSQGGRKMPNALEWTLWVAGAAGITVGTIAFVNARDIEDQVNDPPTGQEVEDPSAEQDEIDKRDTIAYVGWGVGAAALIIGTLSYVLRDGEEEAPTVSFGGSPLPGDTVRVRVRF